ncbi:MAG: DNA adenine methylase [Undibacterium sp.]
MKSEDVSPFSKRLGHFTPLRYPGGKGKLVAFVKKILEENALLDGDYVEPFAGGAAIALELLFHEYVSRIHINDISRPVHSFWWSVLNETEGLCRLINDTPLTVQSWDAQKLVLKQQADHDALSVGFAMFFLNRTNRSGILNGGIIGGRDQSGPWKIDARYNAPELVRRVKSIASIRNRISLTSKDASQFISATSKTLPKNTLVYLDPPYYVKGRQLYLDYYKSGDHKTLSRSVFDNLKDQKWIVSYDNVPEIRDIYTGVQYITYDIGYSARETRQGSEVMFFCEGLKIPTIAGPLNETARMAA